MTRLHITPDGTDLTPFPYLFLKQRLRANLGLSLSMTLAACLVSAAVPAQAAPPPDRFPITVEDLEDRRINAFLAVDTNGDGLISIEEFASADQDTRGKPRHAGFRSGRQGMGGFETADLDDDLWAALDSNGDGTLSRAEFSTAAMADARRSLLKDYAFTRMDDDADGYLTPEEFPPGPTPAVDLDQNGEITREELRAARPGTDRY